MTIRFVVENHVARVTIDRPDRMNAIDEASEAELMRIWSAIERDERVRCVVLTGSGERAFCTGADMKQSGNKTGLEYWASARPGGFGGLALRETLDVPVIARVNGHALGGGMEMVLGCDIVVAADDCRFCQMEAKRGIAPLGGAHFRFISRAGWGDAIYHLFLCDEFSAPEALRIGLVQEIVPAGKQIERAMELAEIIARNAPVCTENLNPNVLTMKSAQYGARIYDASSEPGERQANPCSMIDAFSLRYNSPHSFSESDEDVARPRQ